MNSLNLKFLNDPLGAPLGASNFKPGLETGAVLGIAALAISAFGTTASIIANKNTNDANARINQQNLDFQEEMLLEQERYKSAPNQRALYEEAGYSPYAFLGSTPASIGSTGAPSTVPAQSPDLGGFDKMAELMFNTPTMAADVAGKELDNVGKGYENQQKAAESEYYDTNALSNMVRLRNQAEQSGHEMEKAYWDSRLNAFTFQSKVRSFELENQLREKQIEKINMDTALVAIEQMQAKLNYEFLPKLLSSDLKLKLAQIDTEYSKQTLNYGQYKEAIKGAFLNENLAKKYGIETSRLERTADAYVSIQGELAKQAGWKSWQEMFNAQNAYDPGQQILWNNFVNNKGKNKRYAQAQLFGRLFNTVNPIKLGWSVK